MQFKKSRTFMLKGLSRNFQEILNGLSVKWINIQVASDSVIIVIFHHRHGN